MDAGDEVSPARDFLAAMPMVSDAGLRASLYPKIEPLLARLPDHLEQKGPPGKAHYGRYVRIEIPGKKKTLTLAEVEVYSEGKNVARQGKASQSATAHGGDASKAIDGKKSGNFGDGGQTHTPETGSNPWWEVDLGKEYPVESIVIYNRNRSWSRLSGFTQASDAGKNEVRNSPQPAPAIRRVHSRPALRRR